MKIRMRMKDKTVAQWWWDVDGDDTEDMQWVQPKCLPHKDDSWPSAFAWLKQFVEKL